MGLAVRRRRKLTFPALANLKASGFARHESQAPRQDRTSILPQIQRASRQPEFTCDERQSQLHYESEPTTIMATDFEPRSSSGAEKRASNTQSRKQSTTTTTTTTTTSERRHEKRQEAAREFISIRSKTRSPLKSATESQVNGSRTRDDERKEEIQREFNIAQCNTALAN